MNFFKFAAVECEFFLEGGKAERNEKVTRHHRNTETELLQVRALDLVFLPCQRQAVSGESHQIQSCWKWMECRTFLLHFPMDFTSIGGFTECMLWAFGVFQEARASETSEKMDDDPWMQFFSKKTP